MSLKLEPLFRKYKSELHDLSKQLRQKSTSFHRLGHAVGFGDFEGEVAYVLIRETKPELVYEISPAAGYSTNYLLSALTKNGTGKLRSFELVDKIYGRPTEDVIRDNLVPGVDQDSIEIITGDVTTKEFSEIPNFLLLDSCHERWFAEWYIHNLIPKVKGLVLIQDIAFSDRMEKTGEALAVWEWLKQESIDFVKLGDVERNAEIQRSRLGFAKRNPFETNSLLIRHPFRNSEGEDSFMEKPEDFLTRAIEFAEVDVDKAEDMLIFAENMLSGNLLRTNRHRLFIKIARVYAAIGNEDMFLHNMYLALGDGLTQGSTVRAKALKEIWKETKRSHAVLRYLSSRNSRSRTPVIKDRGFWRVAMLNMLLDRIINFKSWRHHT